MPALRLRLLLLLLALAWGALIWELCTSTRVSSGRWYWFMPWLFNLAHAPLFGLLAALLGLVARPPPAAAAPREVLRAVPPPAARGPFLAAGTAALAYGVALEAVQARIPGRHASGLDVLVDAVGILGVPWALSSGAVFGRRFWPVLAAGLGVSAWATWGTG